MTVLIVIARIMISIGFEWETICPICSKVAIVFISPVRIVTALMLLS